MKKILFGIIALMMGVIFTSCKDEKHNPLPPTFKGFTYSPNPARPGDTITISAIYADRGEYVGSPKCTWKISLDTLNAKSNTYERITYSKKVNSSISDETLSVKYAIPTSARKGQTATCNFDVSFDNYVDATAIGFSRENPTQEGYVGTFSTSTIKSTLYSHCSGSMTFTIE